MESKKWTIKALSEKSGVAIGTIQKLITDPLCNPTISSLKAISEALDSNVSFLLGDVSYSESGRYEVSLFELDDIKANNDKLIIDQSKALTVIKTNIRVNQNAFAIEMSDKSMEPMFQEGTILIFDQDITFHDHSFVLINFKGSDKLAFKQVIIDTPNLYATVLNPLTKDVSVKLLDRADKIVATLIQSQYNFIKDI